MHSLALLALFAGMCVAMRLGGDERAPKGYAPLSLHKIYQGSLVQDGEVKIVIALTQQNLDVLQEKFWAVSDPSHPDYGNHMNFKEVVELVSPSPHSVDTVISWMTQSGIQREKITLHESRDFMNVDMTVAQVENLFKAPLTPYVHKKTGKVKMRMNEGYELPDDVISGLIDFVSPLLSFKKALIVQVPEPSPPTLSSSPSRSLRAPTTTNGPQIISSYTYSNGINFHLFVFCSNNDYPMVSGNNSGTLTCGSVRLVNITATVTNSVTEKIIKTQVLPISACAQCISDDTCKYTTNDLRAILCVTSMISGLTNYLPYTVTLDNFWSDGTKSTSTTTGVMQSSEEVTPDVISRMYSIPTGTIVTQSSNNQTVVGFSEGFLLSDVKAYFQRFGLADYSSLIEIVNGQYVNTSTPGVGEGVLDLVTIMSTARNAKTFYWGESATGPDVWYTWITDVLNSPSPPLVHSVSYTTTETPSSSPQEHARMNIEFMKAGVRGMTIIVSSGDYGVQARQDRSFPAFYPSFPASSKRTNIVVGSYVTSVGATLLYGTSTNTSCYDTAYKTYKCAVTETVASPTDGSSISSGGGFSNLFARPSYQDRVVSSFLATLSGALKSQFNTSGRGYPDISALGHNIPAYYNGNISRFDGTSASTPFVAGLVTLLNDIRLSQGKPPLGFINPLLYSLNSSFFNDVIKGDNRCVPDECTGNGFEAASGWDPVTGLGTLVFSKLADYVRSLPPSPSFTSSTASSTSAVTASSPSPTSSATSPTPSPSSSAPPKLFFSFLCIFLCILICR